MALNGRFENIVSSSFKFDSIVELLEMLCKHLGERLSMSFFSPAASDLAAAAAAKAASAKAAAAAAALAACCQAAASSRSGTKK